ncbi:MAG: transcriptional regulator with XRE-family HTH domain [Paraglaciecola sp.]|jgi:transcriptional regulator with XRE-family HTH domain
MEIRGDIVKQIRTSKSWTQAHLAEICDVNLRTIQRVENQGSASLETIMALCVAFEVKRQALFKVPEPSEIEPVVERISKIHIIIFASGILLGMAGVLVPVVLFS